MFGVLIDGPAHVFCDNCGVVKSPSIPELTLANDETQCNYKLSYNVRCSGSRYFESWKQGQQNKFSRYIA
jgi:hypothetical protein